MKTLSRSAEHAARVAGARKAQGLLVEFRCLFGVGNDDGDVTDPAGHELHLSCRSCLVARLRPPVAAPFLVWDPLGAMAAETSWAIAGLDPVIAVNRQ